MRYVLIIGDGIADNPIDALNGKTPLEALACEGMGRLCGTEMGLVRTVPPECPPGSDTAILSIFGIDPRAQYTGRAALEAAGAGVPLRPGEIAWRANLCTVEGDSFEKAIMRSHNGMGISGQAALDTVNALLADEAYTALAGGLSFTLYPSATFRQMATAPQGDGWGAPLPGPHDHLGESIGALVPRGDIRRLVEASFYALRGRQANCIWPWCPGAAMTLAPFAARYGHAGPVISAVPLVKGIARLAGLEAPEIAGATGELDTNYEGKLDAALCGLRQGADFVAIHIEAPDECSHAMDMPGKLEAIRRIDERIIRPLLQALEQDGQPFRILFLSDHPTLLANGAHDGAPAPYCLYDSRRPGTPRVFCERLAAQGPLREEGTQLMPLLFDAEGTQ